MNKNLLIAVAVLVLVGLGFWFFGSGTFTAPAATNDTATTTTTTPIVAPAAAKTTTVKVPAKGVPNSTTYHSLLTQTGSYQCDYSSVEASGQTSNVIYIYGGKMRGEFRTTSPGSSNANLFVYDGHYMYQWREGASVGTRTVLTSLSQLPLVIPKDLTSGSIMGTSYTSVGWQCHSWLTNKALLMPPSYVTFS